jgi:hypothetical protein
VCEDYVKNFYSAGKPESGEKLNDVAHTFAILQLRRHTADYDVSFDWSRTNAIGRIDLVRAAFEDWSSILRPGRGSGFCIQPALSKSSRDHEDFKGRRDALAKKPAPLRERASSTYNLTTA